MAMDLTISLLGPLRATRGDQELMLGGRRQRAVLARLALAGGSVVGAERLVDELWAGEPPPSAANTLQSYVSNLRRILGPVPGPAIERLGDGYRLAVGDDGIALSSARFEQLAAPADNTDDDLLRGLARLEEGLALWHGDAVAEFADEVWAQATPCGSRSSGWLRSSGASTSCSTSGATPPSSGSSRRRRWPTPCGSG